MKNDSGLKYFFYSFSGALAAFFTALIVIYIITFLLTDLLGSQTALNIELFITAPVTEEIIKFFAAYLILKYMLTLSAKVRLFFLLIALFFGLTELIIYTVPNGLTGFYSKLPTLFLHVLTISVAVKIYYSGKSKLVSLIPAILIHISWNSINYLIVRYL